MKSVIEESLVHNRTEHDIQKAIKPGTVAPPGAHLDERSRPRHDGSSVPLG